MQQTFEFYDALYRGMLEKHIQSGMSRKTIIQVGSATCERAAGSEEVRKEFARLIAASGRSDIVLKQTGCTGRCAREPIVGVFTPDKIPIKYEKVTVDKVHTIFNEHVLGGRPSVSLVLDKKTDVLYSYVATVCSSGHCQAPGAESPEDLLRRRLKAMNAPDTLVRIYPGGCLGLCSDEEKGTKRTMMVLPEKVIYVFENEEQLDEIILSHFMNGRVLEKRRTHVSFIVEQFFSLYGDVAFFNRQTRLTLRNSGIIDPESLSDYVLNKGYEALARVLERGEPNHVLDQISRSGLRGRGGGGFPTGLKWNAAAKSDDPVKYVICNADEGDPGAFMDRSAIEGDPFIVLEGMTIGAFAMGSHQGYIYVRAEYPLAIERLEKAISIAREHHLLGENIMNSGFDFDIEIRLGAGAFVCGEETALMYSIEGRRGQPRMRPPYPAESGLWKHPTVINNVETLANVPTILLYGAAWFANIGTADSKGTKVFALAGKVVNTGLVEVPMGTTLREIIFDIGRGLPPGRTLKAIQTGGPSGGCIPMSGIDTKVDYSSLAKMGSIMGSGGMIVLDDLDCMVATSKFFLTFTQSESCGKCVPCREGTLRMLEILERITEGNGREDDLDKLERLGTLIKKTSLCGLGQTAPNPVLSALKHFREEFEIHIREKRCPAHKCSRLIRYEIMPDKCVGCTLCARRCPVTCISGSPKKPHVINQSACIKCGECFNSCKFEAISKI